MDFKGPAVYGVAYYLIFACIIDWLFFKCNLFIVMNEKKLWKKEIAKLEGATDIQDLQHSWN